MVTCPGWEVETGRRGAGETGRASIEREEKYPMNIKRIWTALTAVVALCAGIVATGSPAGALVPATNGQIVFIRSNPLGNNLAYTANPDGSHQHLLFAGKADFARWSPDGTEVNVRHSDFLAA